MSKKTETQYKVDGRVFRYLRDAIAHRKALLDGRDDMVVVIYKSETGYGPTPEWIPYK
jgi:hypothetical protein